VKYIFATEQIHGAAVEADFTARNELAALLAVDVALDDWQSTNAKRSLSHHLTTAFSHLSDL